MTTAFIFPGQGSQSVGMGRTLMENFPEARDVFAEIDEALKQKLSQIMWEGPEADLTLTANTQPALFAVSLAAFRVLQKEADVQLGRDSSYVAGHSLGEYAALAAAGGISIEDGARLLRIRGNAMQAAVPVGEGAMAALLGLDYEPVLEIAQAAQQGEVCTVANDNAPGQVVVSGHKAAVERAIAIAKERGARRGVLLPVSAPFHCPLMAPAADVMRQALAEAKIQKPVVPLVTNVTAGAVSDPEAIRAGLVEQVTGTVRWTESVRWMSNNGVTNYVEVGAGKVLAGLIKRIAPDAACVSVGDPEGIAAYQATRN